MQVYVGHKPKLDRPIVPWRENLDHIIAPFDFELGHEPNTHTGKNGFLSHPVVVRCERNLVRRNMLVQPKSERNAGRGGGGGYEFMVAEVVDARWATTPIDVTFVGVEANVDTSVGQNDVIGVTGLWPGADGDVRFGKFKPCEVFGSADQNATGWVFDPEIRNFDRRWRALGEISVNKPSLLRRHRRTGAFATSGWRCALSYYVGGN